MELTDYPDRVAKANIAELFSSFPHAELRYSEFDKFLSASMREPQLGSSYSGNKEEANGIFDVLCLYHKGAQTASLSLFLEKNEMKKDHSDHFARIDIVIVEKEFRKNGLGKLLVFTAIKYILDRWGPRIYSISCLAAHEAMAKILEQIGFHGEQRANEDFIRESISFSEVNQAEFSALINERLSNSIQLVKYRLRQPAATPGPQ